jgi:K+-transporting ATPase ATPase C chain
VQAGGSLIEKNGAVIGSALIGQNFTGDKYFHGRPSAIMGTDANNKPVATPYDATNSAASNLGPTAKALIDRIKGDTDALSKENPGGGKVPVDLVTSSASGLDPDITPAGALFQIPRILKARPGLSETQLKTLIAEHTKDRTLGILGEPRVNVLELNLALDEIKG